MKNDGVLLDPEAGRPYVIFARKNYVYQRKENDREFLVLCKKGMTDNCEGIAWLKYFCSATCCDSYVP